MRSAASVVTTTCLAYTNVSAQPQLIIHYIDRLFYDNGSLRAVARHRMLVAACHSTCMGFSDSPIVQFDCIHVRSVVPSLLAVSLILREERSLKVSRPAP